MTYRVHFADGTKLDVDAETPAQARAAAVARHPGVVTKIKLIREQGMAPIQADRPSRLVPRPARSEGEADSVRAQ